MPGHLSSIGVPAQTEDEFRRYAIQAAATGAPINAASGTYVRWNTAQGAETAPLHGSLAIYFDEKDLRKYKLLFVMTTQDGQTSQSNCAVARALARAFDVPGPLSLLHGGEGRAYRAGNYVYRHEADIAEATFIADLYHSLPERGFRVPKPIHSKHGAWVSPDGWSAWTFVEGWPATKHDLPQVIDAVNAFHQALSHVAQPDYLIQRDSRYDRADRAAWGPLPHDIDARLAPLVAQLARYRRPVVDLRTQLIHGDLNEENILVAPGQPPAIIDMTPYWRPPEFALAVLAYWLGPYRGDPTVLQAFAGVPEFDQMLVRAGLRTMLISHEFGKLGGSLDGVQKEFQTPVDIIVRQVTRP